MGLNVDIDFELWCCFTAGWGAICGVSRPDNGDSQRSRTSSTSQQAPRGTLAYQHFSQWPEYAIIAANLMYLLDILLSIYKHDLKFSSILPFLLVETCK